MIQFLMEVSKKARLSQKFVRDLDSAKQTKGQLHFWVMLINWKCMIISKKNILPIPRLISKGEKMAWKPMRKSLLFLMNSEGWGRKYAPYECTSVTQRLVLCLAISVALRKKTSQERRG